METENREIADQEKTENLETFPSSSSSPTLSINSENMATENPEIADQEKTENLETFPSSSSSPTLSINSEKMATENPEIADQEKTENLETFPSSSSSPTLSINSENMATENPEIADQEKTENLEDFPSSPSSPTLSINSEKTATENPEIADQKNTQILEIAGPEKPEIDVEICARTRLKKELKEFNKNPPANVSCGPVSDEDMFHWQGIIIGPADTPLEGSLFHLSIEFPVDYPYEPPNVKFETKIYHPNVGEEGQIHLNVLGEEWSPALTTEILLLSISSILLDPLLLDYPFLLEDTENPILDI